MTVLRLESGSGVYPVLIGPGVADALGEHLRDRFDRDAVLVMIDRRVDALHGARLRSSLRRAGIKALDWIPVPRGESAKSLSRVRSLYDRFQASAADRWTPLVAVGGGVVGDLAGFAGSTYMRGLPLVHVPTTVLAQVDSSIGGKTGVNFGGLKNLVGTFHPPSLVLTDPGFLETLAARDYRAGLVEAVKIGVTLRPDLLERMEAETAVLLDRDPDLLAAVVEACVVAKGDLAARDERDQDVRGILNYGHTIGHALEAAQLGRIRHGEAVAVGMNAAAWIGEALQVAAPEVRSRQNALLGKLGLKLTVPGADKRLIARNLKLDKKVRAKKNRFVLTLQIGGASVWPHISARLLRDAVRFITS